jgi:hypothetical protein
MTARRAATSTVEALVYSCRQGPSALDRSDNVRRLAELDEQQLREVHERVQRFPTEIQYEGRPAKRWSGEQADTLLDKWNACHG